MEHFLLSCVESRVENSRSFYGRFQLGPFEIGQGLTVANALRRTLLSEITGFAITLVEVEGASHEYSTIDGVRESVLDILLNLKQLGLKSDFQIQQPLIGYVNIQGPAVVRAGDLKLPLPIQCVDSEQYIATLSNNGSLKLKFMISQGTNLSRAHLSGAQVKGVKGSSITNQSNTWFEGIGKRFEKYFNNPNRVAEPGSVYRAARNLKDDVLGSLQYKTLNQFVFSKEWNLRKRKRKKGDPGLSEVPNVVLNLHGVHSNPSGVPRRNPVSPTRKSYFLGKGTKGQAKGEVQTKGALRPLRPLSPLSLNLVQVPEQGSGWAYGRSSSVPNSFGFSVSETGQPSRYLESQTGFAASPKVKPFLRDSVTNLPVVNNQDWQTEKEWKTEHSSAKGQSDERKPKSRWNKVSPNLLPFFESPTNTQVRRRLQGETLFRPMPLDDEEMRIRKKTLAQTIDFVTKETRQRYANTAERSENNSSPKNLRLQNTMISAAFAIDAIFEPINKVNYLIETDEDFDFSKEKVILEIWTNGSIHPRTALHKAAQTLIQFFYPFQETKFMQTFSTHYFQTSNQSLILASQTGEALTPEGLKGEARLRTGYESKIRQQFRRNCSRLPAKLRFAEVALSCVEDSLSAKSRKDLFVRFSSSDGLRAPGQRRGGTVSLFEEKVSSSEGTAAPIKGDKQLAMPSKMDFYNSHRFDDSSTLMRRVQAPRTKAKPIFNSKKRTLTGAPLRSSSYKSQTFGKKLGSLDIGNLDFSLQVYTTLKKNNINTINDLISYSRTELVKRMSENLINEIEKNLFQIGLALRL